MDREKTPAPARSEFQMREWPFFWVLRINARYLQVMESVLKPVGLDVPRWRVLMVLYDGEHMSISEIAEICVIKLNTTTKIIQRMVADGLVVTRPRASDGRVTEVTLTRAGVALRHRGWAEAEKVRERVYEGLDEAERKAMTEMLKGMFERLAD